MKAFILSISVILFSLVSCRTETSKEAEQITSSNDLTHITSYGDTINQTIDGLKQGVWVTHSSHDTVVYLNDTAYSVIPPMTSGELMRELGTVRPEEFISYDSIVLNAH